VTEYLLEMKANPNFHKELFTPLMAACASSHEVEDDLVKCVEILIANGSNINATERHKVTPLMFACKEKRLKIVQTLLRREEINIDLQDHRGWSVSLLSTISHFNSSEMYTLFPLGFNVGCR
jgi:ankyrin repeat/SAM/basic leucine zipper domain-containing protein 1